MHADKEVNNSDDKKLRILNYTTTKGLLINKLNPRYSWKNIVVHKSILQHLGCNFLQCVCAVDKNQSTVKDKQSLLKKGDLQRTWNIACYSIYWTQKAASTKWTAIATARRISNPLANGKVAHSALQHVTMKLLWPVQIVRNMYVKDCKICCRNCKECRRYIQLIYH